jgi:Putative restriction endonuclease
VIANDAWEREAGCSSGLSLPMIRKAVSSDEIGFLEVVAMATTSPLIKSAEAGADSANGAIPPLENGDRVSRAYDLGTKLDTYRKNGVNEYVVWRVLDRQIDWFVLHDGRFAPQLPSADGILRSAVFPGLWLDQAALLEGNINAVFAIVGQGLSSPEHADFVARKKRDNFPR